MKQETYILKDKSRSKTPLVKKNRKTRIETVHDEFNSKYYDLLNSNRKEKDLELLSKEIEFYKMQIKAEKNINKSLNKEISHFNEIQKLGENKTQNILLLEQITVLEKKNKFLEENVFKLKNALDKANNLFPNFLEQLQKAQNEKNNDNINKRCITEDNEDKDKDNNIEINNLKQENKKLNNIIKSLNSEIDKLRKEGTKSDENSILTCKMDDYFKNNDRLMEDNKKLKEYINKINELQNNNEIYINEINYLKTIIKENEVKENPEKNIIEKDYKNENIKLIEKNKELEDLKIKNEENIFELINLIKKAEDQIDTLGKYNQKANEKIRILNEKIKEDEIKINELTKKINNYQKNEINKGPNEDQNIKIITELNNVIKSKK